MKSILKRVKDSGPLEFFAQTIGRELELTPKEEDLVLNFLAYAWINGAHCTLYYPGSIRDLMVGSKEQKGCALDHLEGMTKHLLSSGRYRKNWLKWSRRKRLGVLKRVAKQEKVLPLSILLGKDSWLRPPCSDQPGLTNSCL